jgi:hypothetical protein
MTQLVSSCRGGRRRSVLVAGLAALSAVASGCYTNTMMTGRPGDGMVRERSLNFFVAGLFGQEKVDLDAVCPQGVSRFGDLTTFTDGLLGMVTLGFYTPRTAEIECAAETNVESVPPTGAAPPAAIAPDAALPKGEEVPRGE